MQHISGAKVICEVKNYIDVISSCHWILVHARVFKILKIFVEIVSADVSVLFSVSGTVYFLCTQLEDFQQIVTIETCILNYFS